jgi:hypothetical protein
MTSDVADRANPRAARETPWNWGERLLIVKNDVRLTLYF